MSFNIETICNFIENAIKTARIPFPQIPATLLLCGVINRPGLSSMFIASNIIKRQSEAGAPVGPAADGSISIAEAMERIRVEELVKALKMDAKVQVAIPPGSIQFLGTGANAGGPVTINGMGPLAPLSVNGIIS